MTILLAFLFLGETPTVWGGCAVVLIAVGVMLMVEKKAAEATPPNQRGWLWYALLSALFASLTAILGKIGIGGVESNLGTAIRTCVVLPMAWIVVFVTGAQHTLRRAPRRELWFILLSGLATGASWLCYFKALQSGPASVVVPIDKLSILVSIAVSSLVFKERLTTRAALGLCLMTAGTLLLLV